MNNFQEVISKLVNKYGTNDPFEIAELMGIQIIYLDLGNTYGFYRVYKRVKTIVINNKLNEWEKRFVCAHEIGHAIYHPDLNISFLKKNTFYSVEKIESEANRFAVHLLLYAKNLEDYDTKFAILKENGIPYEMEMYL